MALQFVERVKESKTHDNWTVALTAILQRVVGRMAAEDRRSLRASPPWMRPFQDDAELHYSDVAALGSPTDSKAMLGELGAFAVGELQSILAHLPFRRGAKRNFMARLILETLETGQEPALAAWLPKQDRLRVRFYAALASWRLRRDIADYVDDAKGDH